MHKEEKYSGYILQGNINVTQKNATYTVFVLPEESKNANDFVFIEKTEFTGREKDNTFLDLTDATFSKAKTRILLAIFDEGIEYCQTIDTIKKGLRVKPMSDSMIQKWIMRGLVNLRKKYPLNYKEQKINYDGACRILGIDNNQLLFNISILLEDTCIDTKGTEKYNLENGGIYITSYGVHELNFISGPEMPIADDVKLNIESTLREKKDTIVYKSNMAILYAVEDKSIAKNIGSKLNETNISVFYDCYDAAIKGGNLYDYLKYIYTDSARFCILLLTKNYANKLWTDHGSRVAQARAYREKADYILPVKIDDTKIPGLPETVGYFKYDNNTDEIVELAIRKLNESYSD